MNINLMSVSQRGADVCAGIDSANETVKNAVTTVGSSAVFAVAVVVGVIAAGINAGVGTVAGTAKLGVVGVDRGIASTNRAGRVVGDKVTAAYRSQVTRRLHDWKIARAQRRALSDSARLAEQFAATAVGGA